MPPHDPARDSADRAAAARVLRADSARRIASARLAAAGSKALVAGHAARARLTRGRPRCTAPWVEPCPYRVHGRCCHAGWVWAGCPLGTRGSKEFPLRSPTPGGRATAPS